MLTTSTLKVVHGHFVSFAPDELKQILVLFDIVDVISESYNNLTTKWNLEEFGREAPKLSHWY